MNDQRTSNRSDSVDWANRSRFVYSLVRALFTIIFRTRVIRFRCEGLENVPDAGAAMLMSNHQSNLDPVLLGWPLVRPLTIPGKKELFGVPLLGGLLTLLGAFPVDRELADAGALRRSIEALKSGRLVAVFPEGGRSRTGEIGKFHTTLVRVAVRQRVPIVPVAIAGSSDVLAPGRVTPRLGRRIVVVYGEPLLFRSSEVRPADEDLTCWAEETRARVISLHERAALLLRNRQR